MRAEQPGRVLVTGGADGLGAAIVAAVRDAGGAVAVLDRRRPRDPAVPHADADLAAPREAEEAVRSLAEQLGGLDGIVTAAGVDTPGPLDTIDADRWERVVAVNLVGTAATIRAALPYLRRSTGRIVTVSSTLGFTALPHATAYCASKFGVVGFTRALAAELQGEVGVTLVVPGGMRTSFFAGRDPAYQPAEDALLNDPADVAAAVLFALRQPAGCELRELVIAPATETSWPP
jgi:NAD(P)-dependent dehydrogenase (short-subunit alcohol dehydrogenase family)